MKIKLGPYPRSNNRRKISIHIDDYDCWNLDVTLAQIILPSLLLLKKNKQGVPNSFAQVGGEDWDQQECFDFYREDLNEWQDKAMQQWDVVLDKIIWSFYQIAYVDWEQKYHHGDILLGRKKIKDSINPVTGNTEEMTQLVDLNPEEHFFDKIGYDLHVERIQEGLELFGKHYRDFWD
jgi:hypothetical protein